MTERKDATDVGKISLWLDEREDSKTLATGKVHIFLDDGSMRELNVYLYETNEKKNDKSPDYYGYIKETPKQKKGLGSKVAYLCGCYKDFISNFL